MSCNSGGASCTLNGIQIDAETGVAVIPMPANGLTIDNQRASGAIQRGSTSLRSANHFLAAAFLLPTAPIMALMSKT